MDGQRRRAIALAAGFCGLVTALAWLAPLLDGGPRPAASPGPGLLLWGTSPLLAALALRLAARDLSDAGLRPGLRRNAGWYLLSALAFPVVFGLVVAIDLAAGLAEPTGPGFAEYLRVALMALVFFLPFAVFEEFGWRGYLEPKLAATGLPATAGHVLVGVVWAGWHLPYLARLPWVAEPEGLVSLFPRFLLLCVVLSVVLGRVRSASGSVWPAVVMHGVGNAFGHPLVAEHLRLDPALRAVGSPGSGLLTIGLFALLGLALTRSRRSGPAARSPVRPGTGR